jgi:plastocyanin
MNMTPRPFSLFRHPIRIGVPAAFWIALIGLAGPVFAGGNGGVTGRVTINGEAAPRAVVFLQRADGKPRATTLAEQIIRQKDLRFDPDFVVVPAGTTVAFENLDGEIHNIHSRAKTNRFDTGAHMPDMVTRVTLNNPGAVPLRCRTHERMRGLIYVAPSPYFAVTDDRGAFEITGLPAGVYRVEAWHPRLSPEEQARGGADATVAADTTVSVSLTLSAAAPPGVDLTDTMDQNWRAVTDQIREQLLKAVALWKDGAVTAATIRVTTTQSRHYGESGLRDAIATRISRIRADEHERRLDQFRKRIQGLINASDTEANLTRAANEIVNELQRDTERLFQPAIEKP